MLKEIAWLFLKLGTIAFGGPAAHIAMLEDEVVHKRKWMDRQHFLDLVGATNLIPGPNSTEMAIHCGYHRAGVTGLIVAGTCFILPAILLTSMLAFFYLHYGALPQVAPFLFGVKPAVIIIILNAVLRLGRQAAKGWKLIAIGAAVAGMNFFGANEIFCILAGGVIGGLAIRLSEKQSTLSAFFPFSTLSFPAFFQSIEKTDASLLKLFLSFLKIGATLFGSGYVLVAYLDGEFVQGLQWITRQQLLDAIAVGQITPGPVLSTATFIGYQMAGSQGAVLATLGIFLPSFIFVLIINPVVPRLRNSKIFSAFLDAVNISSLAVMLVVGIKLGSEVLTNWKSILVAALSTVAFLSHKKMNSAIIIISGALLGYLLTLVS